MKRIGMAASKIAKDNVFLYNMYVVLISFLFSLFIFFVTSITIFFAFILISYISTELKIFSFEKNKDAIFILCMVSLAVISGLFNILAIIRNIQFSKPKE